MVWGFSLTELSWSAFSRQSMFDPHWYLRPERLGMVSTWLPHLESCANFSLIEYRCLYGAYLFAVQPLDIEY
jgi:hypothetical protein